MSTDQDSSTRKTRSRRVVYIGLKLKMLTVLGRDAYSNHVHVKCDCGKIVKIQVSHFGVNTSCGCYRAKNLSNFSRKHGRSKKPEYASWVAMKSRCYRPKDIHYHLYGGRGIAVCASWLESFENFYADMGARPNGASLDRIDPNGNYERSNCRWATLIEQANNKVNNRRIEYRGETMTCAEASRRFKLSDHLLLSRLNNGWSVERALETPKIPKTTKGLRHKK